MIANLFAAALALTDSILLRTLGLIALLVIAATWAAARILPGLAATRDRLDREAPGGLNEATEEWWPFVADEFIGSGDFALWAAEMEAS